LHAVVAMKSPWAKAPADAAESGGAKASSAPPGVAAPAETPAASASASAAPAAQPTHQGKADYLKGCRTTWASFTKLAASTRPLAIFFTLLPSAYIIAVLIYNYTGLATNTTFLYASQIARVFGGYVASLAALVFVAGILGSVSIAKAWPGVLSVCAWIIEVQAHFLIVLLWMILTASWNAGLEGFYYTFITIALIGVFPAIVVWSFAGAVMTRRREILSGADVPGT